MLAITIFPHTHTHTGAESQHAVEASAQDVCLHAYSHTQNATLPPSHAQGPSSSAPRTQRPKTSGPTASRARCARRRATPAAAACSMRRRTSCSTGSAGPWSPSWPRSRSRVCARVWSACATVCVHGHTRCVLLGARTTVCMRGHTRVCACCVQYSVHVRVSA